jgi:hypothetical protein
MYNRDPFRLIGFVMCELQVVIFGVPLHGVHEWTNNHFFWILTATVSMLLAILAVYKLLRKPSPVGTWLHLLSSQSGIGVT